MLLRWQGWGAMRKCAMRSPHLQLTLHDRRFSVTPLPVQTASICTSGCQCRKVASHRVQSHIPRAVALFCDEHTIDWTLRQGLASAKPAA
ncbi:MAG: hypothetical protein DMF98_27155 [Acidobacteria bacterium]|nr:MAG: hypothetical protein DMF98_27155 [Acidobacteriota bacterium]